MLDFTSALYLGFRHPSRSLRPWSQLSSGKPAALGAPAEAATVARALQELQGCERVTLLPSTLHLFFDLFEMLRNRGVRLYIDAGTYPTVGWGAERAAARGVSLRKLPHFDPIAARRVIAEDEDARLRPVIVADGFCPACGRPVPLRQYRRPFMRQWAGEEKELDGPPILCSPSLCKFTRKRATSRAKRRRIASPHCLLSSSVCSAARNAVIEGGLACIRVSLRTSKQSIKRALPLSAAKGTPKLFASELPMMILGDRTACNRSDPPPPVPKGS